MTSTTQSSSAAGAGIAAGLCALAGLLMLILGFPEGSYLQEVLLQLSVLGLAGVAAVAVVWLAARQDLFRSPTPRWRTIRLIMLALVAVGVLLIVVAVALRHLLITPLGELLVFAGLLVGLVHLLGTRVRQHGQWAAAPAQDNREDAGYADHILSLGSPPVGERPSGHERPARRAIADPGEQP